MRKFSLNVPMTGLAVVAAVALASSSVPAQAADPAAQPGATTGQAMPGAQIQLSQDQRNKLKQALASGEKQSNPAAFVATVGMTVPQEVNMKALPQNAHQDISALTDQHQFARLDNGTIVIADQNRHIVAALREDATTTGAGGDAPR